MRIGILTGGGDCPGLNAVMRAAVRRAKGEFNDTVIGFRDGWRGVVEDDADQLDVAYFRGTLPRGGTKLGSSRLTPFNMEDGVERATSTIRKFGLDAMIVIGGEGSLSCAREVHEQEIVPVVGVPKTIDNDIGQTEMTFGFMTAVEVATEAIDRLHSTAESHNRVMVIEVMGRHVGHIATWAGIAGGASIILIPEEPFDIAEVAEAIRRRHDSGAFASIVVVAEGALPKEGTMAMPSYAVDEFGHERLGGVGARVSRELERRTGYETRLTDLGYILRGGRPSAFDRVLSSWYGVAAVNAIHAGDTGTMVAMQNARVITVPLADAVAQIKPVEPELWAVAQTFFA